MTSYFGFAFELIQMNSNQSVLSCISQNTLILQCHSMHHIVAYCHVLIMFGVSFVVGSASKDNPEYPSEGQYPTTTTTGKQPLIIPIQTHVLVSALVYCIKTTRFNQLCATVVEPLSSA